MRAPPITPDEKGNLAVTVRMRGVDVTVMQFGTRRPGTVFLIAELGAVPEEQALAGWLCLMNANLELAGEHSPAFSRNPRTAEALLQWACALDSVTPVDVYQRISAMVELALQWRHDHVIDDSRLAAIRLLPARTASVPRADFEALYRGLCEATGQALQPMPADEGMLALPISIDGVDAMALHSPLTCPGSALVLVHLGKLSPRPELADVTHVMDINLGLMSESHGATLGREASTGALVLHYTHPLAGASANRLLEQLVALARVARGLRDCAVTYGSST